MKNCWKEVLSESKNSRRKWFKFRVENNVQFPGPKKWHVKSAYIFRRFPQPASDGNFWNPIFASEPSWQTVGTMWHFQRKILYVNRIYVTCETCDYVKKKFVRNAKTVGHIKIPKALLSNSFARPFRCKNRIWKIPAFKIFPAYAENTAFLRTYFWTKTSTSEARKVRFRWSDLDESYLFGIGKHSSIWSSELIELGPSEVRRMRDLRAWRENPPSVRYGLIIGI